MDWVLQRLDQPALQDELDELRIGLQLQFFEDSCPMCADGLGAPPQLVSGLPDALAPSEETEDLVLPVREPLHDPFGVVP